MTRVRVHDQHIAGTLVRRYDRFLADVTLASGETVAVHCVNSGSMEGFVSQETHLLTKHHREA